MTNYDVFLYMKNITNQQRRSATRVSDPGVISPSAGQDMCTNCTVFPVWNAHIHRHNAEEHPKTLSDWIDRYAPGFAVVVATDND